MSGTIVFCVIGGALVGHALVALTMRIYNAAVALGVLLVGVSLLLVGFGVTP